MLHILDRNMRIKEKPERFQESKTKYDLIFTCEEKVYDQVLAYFETNGSTSAVPVHIINIDVIDNPEGKRPLRPWHMWNVFSFKTIEFQFIFPNIFFRCHFRSICDERLSGKVRCLWGPWRWNWRNTARFWIHFRKAVLTQCNILLNSHFFFRYLDHVRCNSSSKWYFLYIHHVLDLETSIAFTPTKNSWWNRSK